MSKFATSPELGKETAPSQDPTPGDYTPPPQTSQSNSFVEDREGGEDAVLEAKVEKVYRSVLANLVWTLKQWI